MTEFVSDSVEILDDTNVVGNSQSVTDFDEDASPNDVPKHLPSVVKLRREISNNLQLLQSKLDSAEEAFHKEQYFDAVDKYEEVNRRREELKQKIARYDAGFAYIDNTTVAHLTPTETFTTELSLITERANKHLQEAFRTAERIKGLELLVAEICEHEDAIRDRIEAGDQMRRSGKVEEGHLKYERAKNDLEDLRQTVEIYQGLISEYDDVVIKSHQGTSEEISLSGLESEISSRLDSFEEHLEVPQVAEEATGTFSVGLLTRNSGLFDKDLIEYINDTEKLEFVFKPPRRGVKIVLSGGTEEMPYDDSLQGSCYLLITDKRILYIAGVNGHDEKQSVTYERLSDVTASAEASIPTIQFQTVDGKTYEFLRMRDHISDLEPAANYVRNELERRDSI